MKIKTEELKKFLEAASQIRINPLYPALDCIKIECTGQEVVFTKTNNNIHCTYSYVCSPDIPECFLINERVLNGVILTTNEYQLDINLSPTGTEILITNGETILKEPVRDLLHFPNIQFGTGDKIKISKEALERIIIAAKYISNAKNITALNYVNIGEDGIFGSDGETTFYHKTNGLPNAFFDSQQLQVIKPKEDVFYYCTESYDYFNYDGFVYGFIKSIFKPVPFMNIINKPIEKNCFTLYKKDLINFCIQVIYTAKENKLAGFSGGWDVLSLKYIDADFNKSADCNIKIASNYTIPEFRFNAEKIYNMLNALPYEQLIFNTLDVHYRITTPEDENYVGIIAKLN